jgi:hypothetical protein
MSAISAIIAKYLPDIELTIQRGLEDSPMPLRGMLQYHFGWAISTLPPWFLTAANGCARF